MLWIMGLTWTPLSINGGNVRVYSFGDTLAAVGITSIWVSYNRGNSWNLAYWGNINSCCVKAYTISSKKLFFANGNVVYELDLNTLSTSTFPLPYGVVGMVGEPHPNPSLYPLYIFTSTSTLDSIIVFKSTDGGASWSEVSRFFVGYNTRFLNTSSNGSTIFTALYTANPTDSTLKFYLSNNGGLSWSLVYTLPATSGNYQNVYSTDILPGKLLFTVLRSSFPQKGLLYISTDGGSTWNAVDSSDSWGFAKFVNDSLIIGFRPVAASKNWVVFNINTNSYTVIDTFDIPRNYDLTPYGWVFGLASNGVRLAPDILNPATWSLLNNGLRAYTVIRNAISINGSDILIVDVSGNRIFLSNDNGATWNKVYNPIFDYTSGLGGFSVEFFGTNKALSSIVNTGAYSVLSKSSDGGNTWTPLMYNLNVMVDIQRWNGDTLLGVGLNYIFGQSGVFRSFDGGSSWANTYPYALPLNYQSFTHKIIKSGSNLYLLRETTNAFVSNDMGTSFNIIPNPSPNDTILSICPANSGFYALVSSPTFNGIRLYNGSWTDVWTSPSDISPNRLLADISSNGNFVVATFNYSLPMVYYRGITSAAEGMDTLPDYILPTAISITADDRIIVCSGWTTGCVISDPLVGVSERVYKTSAKGSVIYDVLGRRVKGMDKRGVYFVKEGEKVKKVIVK